MRSIEVKRYVKIDFATYLSPIEMEVLLRDHATSDELSEGSTKESNSNKNHLCGAY